MNDARLLLIGGGHAHVAVLADWVRSGLPARRATLLTPHPTLRYSGMVPGWISGQYGRDEGLVDLAGLARQAGVELVLDRCARIAPDRRMAFTENGQEIAFDIASIDSGGVGRARAVLGEDPRVLDIRPIAEFVRRLHAQSRSDRIAIVGGGAGGVEIAFALRNASAIAPRPEVLLVAGNDGLLPGFSRSVRRRVRAELAAQAIGLIEVDARIDDGTLIAGDAALEPVDLIVAALGSAAPEWPRASGMACDTDGFIAVDRHQRSILHPHIFAVGDVASRQDRDVPHSGVHAVRAGPVLAANLRAAANGLPPGKSYRPRPASLYLLSTGNGSAIASYGPVSAQGRWVARLKSRIDTSWIDTYAHISSHS
ncbi:FAD-dependent oxidoreductase [Erythrobacter sp. JK5]|uniref:FAD-dependent oxidoreductase n=1 Tax=Erythrobacter sp. JK5 TaxID=2829500 RepID=UPI001BA83ACC|nr:FAD-dependent oxidoreductase [Erythrobacter sp. JK5]QUL38012.1 FAD-dependent oxidoreductase [Erythrobacter sp. JK5]